MPPSYSFIVHIISRLNTKHICLNTKFKQSDMKKNNTFMAFCCHIPIYFFALGHSSLFSVTKECIFATGNLPHLQKHNSVGIRLIGMNAPCQSCMSTIVRPCKFVLKQSIGTTTNSCVCDTDCEIHVPALTEWRCKYGMWVMRVQW